MFSVYCHRHQSRVVLGPRAIQALLNTSQGVVLQWRCHCGATGAERLSRNTTAHSQPAKPAA
jgi:hypothetical protein